MKKRIFVYTEESPVHRNIVAHGLQRAAPPILRSILDHIDGIAIDPIGRWFHTADLDPELAALCTRLPRIPTLLFKALRRYPRLALGASELPSRLLARHVRRSNADILFCFIGADIQAVTRAARVASLAGKPYALYLVDDFVPPLHLAGIDKEIIHKAETAACTLLHRASHIFTITDGLGKHLRESYGVSSTTLQLAFEPGPRPTVPVENQIIYVGSINFLYADGLRDLFETVRLIRASGVDLTVRLTLNPRTAAQLLGELPPFVVSAPVETAEGLAAKIASSIFAFLPYSFDQRHRGMVSTSFPSKSMEYLAYGRSIVVYGPDYGVATQYFQKAGLPTVVSSLAQLEATTRNHLAFRPDHTKIYRQYLAVSNSLMAVRRVVCSNLGLETR